MKARIALALLFAFAATVIAQVPDVTRASIAPDGMQAPLHEMFPFPIAEPFMIEGR